jgi:pyruvate carboxylase subunit B
VVKENGKVRTFMVTVEPVSEGAVQNGATPRAAPVATSVKEDHPVFSSFSGTVDVVNIKVKVGDSVNKGDVVAQVEAMKAQHDIKAPCAGVISAINVAIGDEVDSSKPILIIS